MSNAVRLLLVAEFFQLKHREIRCQQSKRETHFSTCIDQIVSFFIIDHDGSLGLWTDKQMWSFTNVRDEKVSLSRSSSAVQLSIDLIDSLLSRYFVDLTFLSTPLIDVSTVRNTWMTPPRYCVKLVTYISLAYLNSLCYFYPEEEEKACPAVSLCLDYRIICKERKRRTTIRLCEEIEL